MKYLLLLNFTKFLKTKTTGKLASCLGVFPTPYIIKNTELLFSITTTVIFIFSQFSLNIGHNYV